jgi:hypothetical protein
MGSFRVRQGGFRKSEVMADHAAQKDDPHDLRERGHVSGAIPVRSGPNLFCRLRSSLQHGVLNPQGSISSPICRSIKSLCRRSKLVPVRGFLCPRGPHPLCEPSGSDPVRTTSPVAPSISTSGAGMATRSVLLACPRRTCLSAILYFAELWAPKTWFPVWDPQV